MSSILSLDSSLQSQYENILEAARLQGCEGAHVATAVTGHLQQMVSLIIQKGIYFYCPQDTFTKRTSFIQKVLKLNRFDIRLPAMIRNFLLDGKGLFYLQPDKDKQYIIHFFRRDQYRVFRDATGGINEVVIIYKYYVKNTLSGLPGVDKKGAERWVRMSVTQSQIVTTESDAKPDFDQTIDAGNFGTKKEYPNEFGYVPAVEVLNNPNESATDGWGDFEPYKRLIVEHDKTVDSILSNIDFFGQPTLVSSLAKGQLIENGGQGVYRPTVSSQSGFRNSVNPSTYKTDPFGMGGGGGVRARVPRLIANVTAADKVGYIQVDPVPGDLTRYSMQLREELRTILGGVDEISISAGATAFELKGLYGRAIATAKVKAKALLDWGFCDLLTYVILHQEKLFKDSFSALSGLDATKPTQAVPNSPQELIERSTAAYKQWEAQRDQMIQQALQQGTLPPGIIGLPPDGDATVTWRNEGTLFEDSAQDQYNKSIVVRNLQELGVNTTESVRFMFPEKNDNEIQQMLTGLPFRVTGAAQQSLQSYLSLIGGLMQTPHPMNPAVPLAQDPNLNMMPFLQRTMQYINQEMTYGSTFIPGDPSFDPAASEKLTKKALKEIEQQVKEQNALAAGTMQGQYPAFGSDPMNPNNQYYGNMQSGNESNGPQYQTPTNPYPVGISDLSGLQIPNQQLQGGMPSMPQLPQERETPQPGVTLSMDPNTYSYPGQLPVNQYKNPNYQYIPQKGDADLSLAALKDPNFIRGLIAPPM